MPLDSQLEGSVFAEAAGLVYVHDGDPGLRRRRSGYGFVYARPDGGMARDRALIERIRALAIPPAWTDVWICPDPRGHIQAVGRDQKGRKQYIYHPDWRTERDSSKYAHMAALGRALPALRKRVEQDLSRPGLPREKVLAAVVRLLEMTHIRIGNDEYAAANKSFGLTTMRKRHVDISGAGAVFEFSGKSGKLHRTGFRDRRLARIVHRCEALPGQRLFQYVDAEGARHAINSHDVNTYIREVSSGPFSAKDFRTWAGTLACAQALTEIGPADSPADAKRRIATCVKCVAQELGNTPAVCRKSYIHPAVFQAYQANTLAGRLTGGTREQAERALLRFLEAQDDAVTRAPRSIAPPSRAPRQTGPSSSGLSRGPRNVGVSDKISSILR